MIAIDSVSKIYNSGRPDELRAVSEVSAVIDRAGVTVLQGPSGSGKTTLLSIIGCMARPSSGKVLVDGRDVAKLPERFLTEIRRRAFGFIFQQFNLIRGVSVLENVTLPLYPLAMGPAVMHRRAEGVLASLGLAGRARIKVNKLSGGEQQRVAIARALINEPEIIVADEPTAHLDRVLASEFLAILQGLNRQGKTVIIATHDPLVYEHAFVTCVIKMRDGRIEEVSKR